MPRIKALNEPTRACEHCGGTGSVRVYSYEDYGVSFECEACEYCVEGRVSMIVEAVT